MSDVKASIIISSRILEDLFDRRVAVENAAQTVLPQRYHSELNGLFPQGDRRRAFIDQLSDWVRDRHQFVDSLTALVPSLVAGVAAFAVIKTSVPHVAPRDSELVQQAFTGLIGRPALWANAPEQALAQHGFERGRN